MATPPPPQIRGYAYCLDQSPSQWRAEGRSVITSLTQLMGLMPSLAPPAGQNIRDRQGLETFIRTVIMLPSGFDYPVATEMSLTSI